MSNVLEIEAAIVQLPAKERQQLAAWLQADHETAVTNGSVPHEALLREVESLWQECRVPNWDGHKAEAVSRATLEAAKRFVTALPADLPAPELSAAANGDISFEWFHAQREVCSVGVSGDGELCYASLHGAHKSYGTESFRDRIPAPVLLQARRAAARGSLG